MQLKLTRRSFGLALMGASLTLAMLAPLGAVAAEGEKLPEDRTEVGEADIKRTAYWNGKPSDTVPTAITKQFPPEAACLVAPQLCNFPTGDKDPTSSGDPTGGAVTGAISGEEEPKPGAGALGNALLDGINEQYGTNQETFKENERGAPAEPVPPNSLPVSIAFGQPYYRSAIEFELPDVPEGDVVDQFLVVFEQGNPTFANSSPALRQAVLATLTCARESETGALGGRCESDEFQKVADAEKLQNGDPLPYQLCAIGADPISGEDDPEWEAGEAKDEDTLPSTNCLLGSRGTEIEVEGTTFWVFDMTFAMNAWAAGDIPNEGMLFRPGSAENFAFGDAETSYSKQVTLRSDGVSYAMTTSPAPAPPPPFESPALPTTTTGTATPPPGSGASGDFFGTPPTPASGSPVSVPTSDQATTEQPAVAGGDDTAAPQTAAPSEDLLATPAGTPTGSDWYVWLLVVPFLGGAYLLARSLEEQAALAPARSGGALTRLLERQAAASRPDLVG